MHKYLYNAHVEIEIGFLHAEARCFCYQLCQLLLKAVASAVRTLQNKRNLPDCRRRKKKDKRRQRRIQKYPTQKPEIHSDRTQNMQWRCLQKRNWRHTTPDVRWEVHKRGN